MTYSIEQFRKMNKKKKKYNNKTSKASDGYIYDSKLEHKIAQDLDLRIKAGELTHYDRQVTFHLYAYGKKICTYRLDFVAYLPDGSKEYIEVKGFPTPVWKLKWKLFEAWFESEIREKEPDSQLRIIYK